MYAVYTFDSGTQEAGVWPPDRHFHNKEDALNCAMGFMELGGRWESWTTKPYRISNVYEWVGSSSPQAEGGYWMCLVSWGEIRDHLEKRQKESRKSARIR